MLVPRVDSPVVAHCASGVDTCTFYAALRVNSITRKAYSYECAAI